MTGKNSKVPELETPKAVKKLASLSTPSTDLTELIKKATAAQKTPQMANSQLAVSNRELVDVLCEMKKKYDDLEKLRTSDAELLLNEYRATTEIQIKTLQEMNAFLKDQLAKSEQLVANNTCQLERLVKQNEKLQTLVVQGNQATEKAQRAEKKAMLLETQGVYRCSAFFWKFNNEY